MGMRNRGWEFPGIPRIRHLGVQLQNWGWEFPGIGLGIPSAIPSRAILFHAFVSPFPLKVGPCFSVLNFPLIGADLSLSPTGIVAAYGVKGPRACHGFFFPSQTPLASRAIVCSLREQFVFFLAPLELPLFFFRPQTHIPIIDLRACTLQQVSVTRIFHVLFCFHSYFSLKKFMLFRENLGL